jgi:hypothetical protein
MMRARLYAVLLCLGVAVLAAGSVQSADKDKAAPKPADDEKPKNLKVLPKTTTEEQLHTIMRGYASGLGVGCNYCHVANTDRTMNFPADDKRTKKVAREMMRMVANINTATLAKIPERPSPAVEVTCMTCHRGLPRPKPLGDEVAEALQHGGLDSARATYQRLHAKYYGRAAYDFGEPSLIGKAIQLTGAHQFQPALDLLKLNEEQFPTSAMTVANRGEVHLAMGDTAAALEDFHVALARDSTSGAAKFRLRQLEKK